MSSTYVDLKHHRSFVIEALRDSGLDVDAMEDWTADSDAPKGLSLDRLNGADLCVLLVALRRGYVPVGEQRSITQLEHDAAIERGIDDLVFLLDEDAPWSRKFDELDDDAGLREWRQSLKESKVVGFFSTAPESVPIAPALSRWLQGHRDRPAAIDANRFGPYLDRLSPVGDLAELLDLTLRELEQITRTDYNQIFLVVTNEYSRELVAVADAIPSRKQRYRRASFSGLLGTALASGKTLNAACVRERPGYFQAVPETLSELVVPIRAERAVLGVVNSESENADHFTEIVRSSVEALVAALGEMLPRLGWTGTASPNAAPWIQRKPLGDG